MSDDTPMLDIIEENLEAAIARQQAGRVTREECIEAMARAISDIRFADAQVIPAVEPPWSTFFREAEAALDAAIASGHVIRP